MNTLSPPATGVIVPYQSFSTWVYESESLVRNHFTNRSNYLPRFASELSLRAHWAVLGGKRWRHGSACRIARIRNWNTSGKLAQKHLDFRRDRSEADREGSVASLDRSQHLAIERSGQLFPAVTNEADLEIAQIRNRRLEPRLGGFPGGLC